MSCMASDVALTCNSIDLPLRLIFLSLAILTFPTFTLNSCYLAHWTSSHFLGCWCPCRAKWFDEL